MLNLRIPVKRFNIGDIVRVINSKSHHNGRIGVITQSNYSIKWLDKEAEDKVDRSNFMSCNLKLVEDDFEPGEYPIIADNLEPVYSRSREEIIANERYHTCGRCKWENNPSICHQCKWEEDTRKDLWELKEESDNE